MIRKQTYSELILNITKYGVNREPMNKIIIPTTNVTIRLLKGDIKFVKINIGKIVSDTNVILPLILILCSLPQLRHIIGLYNQPPK